MIRVGVDAWNLPGDRRGIGRYVRALLAAWRSCEDRITVTLIVPEHHTWIAGSRYTREAGACGYRVCSRALHRRARLDMLWFPFNGPSWTSFALPAVATLHDASTFVLPGFGEESRATFRTAARRCAHVITDSQFSKGELERELLLEPDRVTAIPLGVAAALAASSAAIDVRTFGHFVLFVGESEPRKGLG
ncbi:MAG: glycosyltransferase, partial [Candidatus Eremiobacteraeota bacterium]|nr:glycosyltransferase [Candidatus Eremiobacteraeota bacterium]